MRQLYYLGGASFQNKKDIKWVFRDIIAKTEIGETIDDLRILDLLSKHPKWHLKSQGMIRLVAGWIDVAHANVRVKGVLIETADGTVDITWSRLVDRLQPNGTLRVVDRKSENLFKVKVAARAAIQDQINKVQKSPGDHIDHIYPRTFDRLLFIFLKWWGVPIDDIQINDPPGQSLQIRFQCWELEMNWQAFHQRVARLRAIPAAENMAAPIYPVDWNSLP